MKNPFLADLIRSPELVYPYMLSSADNMRSVFVPHEHQDVVLTSPARNKAVLAGRRWGKTLTAASFASNCILAGELTQGLMPTRGWVVSKDYGLADKVTRLIYQSLVIKSGVKTKFARNLGTNAYLQFKYGSVMEAKSAENPDSLIGEGLDWLVFDEFASCKAIVWEQYLRPTLTDREGVVLFIGTPRGYNWAYDLFLRGQSSEFPTWQSWRSPSWDNPHLSKDEIEQAKAELSQMVFGQEYGASFQSNVGAVYSDFDIEAHGLKDIEINPLWKHYRCFDFGYENPFVCLWIAVDPSDVVHVYDEYYVSHKLVADHIEAIKKIEESHARLFNYQVHESQRESMEMNAFDAVVYQMNMADPEDAAARAEMAQKGIQTITPSGNNKRVQTQIDIIRALMKYRSDGSTGFKVDIDRCPNTVRELQNWHYPELRNAHNASENPVEEDDHTCKSLGYFGAGWKRGFIRELEAIY